MRQDINCMYCDHEIRVDDIFCLGQEFICPCCGKVNVLDWDYLGWGNPIAWFVASEDDLQINQIENIAGG